MKYCRLALLSLTLLSPLARADEPLECSYNAAKFVPAFTAAIKSYLKANISFDWNQSSLKIACSKDATGEAEYECAVSFSAKDGTAFFLHDDVITYQDQWGNVTYGDTSDKAISLTSIDRSQDTNSEGNYVGPVNCTADLNRPVVENKKTGVEVVSGVDLDPVGYTQ